MARLLLEIDEEMSVNISIARLLLERRNAQRETPDTVTSPFPPEPPMRSLAVMLFAVSFAHANLIVHEVVDHVA